MSPNPTARPRRCILLAIAAVVVALAAGIATIVPWRSPDTRWRALGQPLGEVARVGWITGPDSVNRTAERWNVHGADLGHPILHDGDLFLVFGDIWGADGSEGDDWRSNGIARMASADPREGTRIAAMVTDGDGQSAELLHSQKIEGEEKTVIPTHGISVDGQMILHYMSVRRWLDHGRWEVGHAGFATSDDDGATWTRRPDAVLAGDGPFAQVAMVADGAHVLVFGIPAGRFGPVHLARAPRTELLDLESWGYWDGTTWRTDRRAAVPVVHGPVGELSVQWNEHLGRWLMLYLDESVGAVMLRSAPAPAGPWSAPRLVTAAEQYPQLYAPYIVPGADTGNELYFTMSQFGPYQVGLMRLGLSSIGLVPDQTQSATEPDPADLATAAT